LPKIYWWEKRFFGIKEENLLKSQKASEVLADYLRSSPEWRSVYSDGLAEIFIRAD
jgi:hypothetical protein